MCTDLVMHEIFRNLTCAQIDEMQMYNREIRVRIQRYRLQYPAFKLGWVSIDISEDGTTYSFHGSSTFSYSRNDIKHVKREDIMKYLRNVRVETLSIKNESILEYLNPKWLRSIEKINIYEPLVSKDTFSCMLPKISPTKIYLESDSFNIDLDAVLDIMPCVEELAIWTPVNHSPVSLDTISEKSRLGPGINSLTIHTKCNGSFKIDQLIKFIKSVQTSKIFKFHNAKFCNQPFESKIFLQYIAGTARQFEKEIYKLNKLPGWEILAFTTTTISNNAEDVKCCIATPTATVALLLRFPGEDN